MLLRSVVEGVIKRPVIIAVHDMMVVVLALPVALVLLENRIFDAARARELAAMLPTVAAATLATVLLLAPHRALWRRISADEIVGLGRFVGAAIFLFGTMQFAVDGLAALPSAAPAIHFLVALFGLLGSRVAYDRYRKWRERGRSRPDREHVVLVGAGDGASLVLEILRGQGRGSDIVGIVDDVVEVGRRLGGVPVLGPLDAFEATMAQLQVEGRHPARLIVTRPHHELGRERLYRLMEQAEAAGLCVQQLPDVVELDAHTAGADQAEASAAVGDSEAVAPPVKRLIEVVAALLVLILFSPLLVLAAAAVAIGVQRPVLFAQMRPGLRGRPYRLLKLRTMRDPVDGTGRRFSDEERTPRVGRILRRTRLDELPQLVNVLAGDMSLIGPRPLLASDLDAMPDGGQARSAVRPGLTGWAQVNGGHQLAPDEKLALDLWYAANADLTLDLLILWRTLVMVIAGERRRPTVIADARASLGVAHGLAPAE